MAPTGCPERSEGSFRRLGELLRYAQHDIMETFVLA